MTVGAVTAPRLEAAFQLRSGRRLGFAEYGPATGRPILWFHGTPGGRRQIPPLARELAIERDVRLVAVERPGIGDSSRHRYSGFREFTDDIVEFTDALGVRDFSVVALSGGGPYALACGAHLADRVPAIVTLGGVAPVRGPDANDGGIIAATAGLRPALSVVEPAISALVWGILRVARPFKNQGMDAFAKLMPPHDQAMFARPEIREMFFDDLIGASSHHAAAPILDALMFMDEWDFQLADVQARVLVFHGDADIIVPLDHAERMAAALPHARFVLRPGESHLGGLDLAAEIFDFLC